ncbi:hypothetical protein BBP40_007637 [Aspergillus hancockii]|nr:hypothetical protein BBP40_007637 [Aspergillus hancockii]
MDAAVMDSAAPMNVTLPLVFGDIKYPLRIDRKEAPQFKYQWDQFRTSLPKESSTQPKSAADIGLRFLQFLLQNEVGTTALSSFLKSFGRDFLQHTEIHSLVSSIPGGADIRQSHLQSYYAAACSSGGFQPRKSALLTATERGRAQTYALFGGQGSHNPKCAQDLASLYGTYRPFLSDLIDAVAPRLYGLSCLPDIRDDCLQGRSLDLHAWLRDPSTIPNLPSYIASAPVSLPIIGIHGLADFCITCKVLGKTPGELVSLLRGVTGHSQGIVVAAAVAAADTWESFYEISRLVVDLLFWAGVEGYRSAPRGAIPASAVHDSVEKGYGQPSPMLSVRGLNRRQIETLIEQFNGMCQPEEKLYLSLANARDNFVVAGPASALVHLNSVLEARKADDTEQARVPFSKRKPVIVHQFLPVSAPFHTPYLEEAAARVKETLSGRTISAEDLRVPVYHSQTGQDMRSLATSNIVDVLINAILCEPCDWPAAIIFPGASHIVSYGRGIGELVRQIKDGHGVRVILGSHLESRDKDVGTKANLFSPRWLPASTCIESWAKKFQPRLAISPTGELQLVTRLTQLLGTPPVMVAGMTPTTAHWDFVSAVMNAGYHIELAGGGYHCAADMSTAINELVASIPAARGVTCNLIYANPRALAWQVALLRHLSQKGVPVDGLTIGAGVPSPEVVAEYIKSLGLRHIGFKPGSVAAIQQVIKIAQLHPHFPIILQWTGGRAGGHHSFEDFHSPVLSSYSAIRKCQNIILVAGSGFGGGDEYQYLSGSWSSALGYAPMPFDGILLGSRMMAVREAHTSPAAKKCIAYALGVPDSEWEKTYSGAAGGVISVISEMGQPMHKIATRGVLLWAEMDRTIFSLPRKDRVAALLKSRDHIISRLNADFAKPWFGRNADNKPVEVSDMTYGQVLNRLVDLMYVRHEKRWINETYTTFVVDFAVRAIERFPADADFDALLSTLSNPDQFLETFSATYSDAANHLLDPEDASFFLMRCKARGQKPVNFIPCLDEDFEYYFKKDSLWQSEDIDAVPGQDAGRVCILHGPVAAQYTHKEDESAKEVLDGISLNLIEQFQSENDLSFSLCSSGSGALTPTSSSSADVPNPLKVPTDSFKGSLVSAQEPPNWATVFFNGAHIIQGHERRQNPFPRILQLHPGESLTIDQENHTALLTTKVENNTVVAAKMVCQNDVDISVELHQPSAFRQEPVILPLQYRFDPGNTSCSLSEKMEGRNDRIKSFYSQLWFGEDVNPDLNLQSVFSGPEMRLTSKLLRDLVSTVNQSYTTHENMFINSGEFPISVGIIVAREVLLKPLTLRDVDGDLLRLVHQSNDFEYCNRATPLRVGDVVTSTSRVQALKIKDSGKQLVVEAFIERQGEKVMKVTSSFLFRGSFDDFSSTFQHRSEPERILEIPSTQDEAILRARKWFVQKDASFPLVGKTLLFKLNSTFTWKNALEYRSLTVHGLIYVKQSNGELAEVGAVQLTCGECVGNPVVDFLERKGTLTIPGSDLKSPGWSGASSLEVRIPSSNERYARVSRDFNPIHVSNTFASWAELPGTITHGMYTSAVSAGVLEHLAADGRFSRVRRWKATFTGMVLPSDVLTVKLQHTGMRDGRMVFQVSAKKRDTDEIVLEAEAELEQPRTAYIFTGQGSQVQGMGMDLYNSSPIAKAIWDKVDQYFQESYGWSIIDIIKNNPKILTVHFRGKRGRKMRDNYLALSVEDTAADGQVIKRPILRNLSREAQSYTFSESGGLLFSTQFAQLAILLYETSAFEDLRSKGYIQRDAIFAGHSLGEYAAIWAFSGFMPLLSLMELIFYRGLTMQATMVRGQHGETNFGMVAANPQRIGKWCNEKSLDCVVKMIATESQSLLEIVNFNVNGEQYVCAGSLKSLHVLGEVLNQLSKAASNGQKLLHEAIDSLDASTTDLGKIIARCVRHTETLAFPIKLSRGVATIPLQGIDVPFHSTHLLSGVQAFRSYLQKQIREDHVHPERLIGRWIPNLLARPFSLEDEFVQTAVDASKSPILKEVLAAR